MVALQQLLGNSDEGGPRVPIQRLILILIESTTLIVSLESVVALDGDGSAVFGIHVCLLLLRLDREELGADGRKILVL